MKSHACLFAAALFCTHLISQSLFAAPIDDEEVAYQNQNYEQWWQTPLERRFDELPKLGVVEKHRMPYSGAIYPDRAGGTAQVLRKYDMAFHRGRQLATRYEAYDIEIHKEHRDRMGPFGVFRWGRNGTPEWAGHCNGWTAAAIRHAEPENNVVRNGVTFTPADIKGLLAELYTYTDIEFLGGVNEAINPGTLHVTLCNWVGRQKYPIGMDTTVGKEVWNYPIYGYNSSSAKRGNNEVEVKVNLAYVYYTNGEYNRGPSNARYMYLHYQLELNDEGEIMGGRYYRDSNQLDMMWVPLKPTTPGEPGNEGGNPYMDIDSVLALWRDSVPEEKRMKWYVVDPFELDRVERNLADSEAVADAGEVHVEETNDAEPSSEAANDDQPVVSGEPVLEAATSSRRTSSRRTSPRPEVAEIAVDERTE